MTDLVKQLEVLILQTYNYKEVLSYICEAEEFVGIQPFLREQVQQRLAFIKELEDIYMTLNINNKSLNQNQSDIVYWINYEAVLVEALTKSNQRCLEDYNNLLKKFDQKSLWYQTIYSQNEKVALTIHFLKNSLLTKNL